MSTDLDHRRRERDGLPGIGGDLGRLGVVIGRFLGNRRARVVFNWSMAVLLVLSLVPVFW